DVGGAVAALLGRFVRGRGGRRGGAGFGGSALGGVEADGDPAVLLPVLLGVVLGDRLLRAVALGGVLDAVLAGQLFQPLLHCRGAVFGERLVDLVGAGVVGVPVDLHLRRAGGLDLLGDLLQLRLGVRAQFGLVHVEQHVGGERDGDLFGGLAAGAAVLGALPGGDQVEHDRLVVVVRQRLRRFPAVGHRDVVHRAGDRGVHRDGLHVVRERRIAGSEVERLAGRDLGLVLELHEGGAVARLPAVLLLPVADRQVLLLPADVDDGDPADRQAVGVAVHQVVEDADRLVAVVGDGELHHGGVVVGTLHRGHLQAGVLAEGGGPDRARHVPRAGAGRGPAGAVLAGLPSA